MEKPMTYEEAARIVTVAKLNGVRLLKTKESSCRCESCRLYRAMAVFKAGPSREPPA